MSSSSLSDKESKILNSLHTYLTKVSGLYDFYKSYLNADIAYFENAEKTIKNLTQSLNFRSDPQFTSHPLFEQPSGKCLNDMLDSFDAINVMINLDTLPNLRQKVTELESSKAMFDKKIEENMGILKKSLQFYHEQTALNSKNKPKEMIDLVETQCSKIGSKQYQNYSIVVSEIDSVEMVINNELTKEDQTLKEVMENEYKFIIGQATRFTKSLPFMNEFTKVRREFEDTNSVSYFRYFISETFLELKCHFTQHKMMSKESAARAWISEDEMQPFYARVWVDRAPQKDNELQVYKKEIVKVTQAGFSDFWIAQNSNIKCGYVPTEILEPVS